MTRNQIFPSRWLKASDLSREGQDVTIRKVTAEEIGEAREKKPICAFDEIDKELVVNVTNWNITELTGEDDSDNWAGLRREVGTHARALRRQERRGHSR
jgi:hypothetical protein